MGFNARPQDPGPPPGPPAIVTPTGVNNVPMPPLEQAVRRMRQKRAAAVATAPLPAEAPEPGEERKVRIVDKVVTVPRPSSEMARRQVQDSIDELTRRQAQAEAAAAAAIAAQGEQMRQESARTREALERYGGQLSEVAARPAQNVVLNQTYAPQQLTVHAHQHVHPTANIVNFAIQNNVSPVVVNERWKRNAREAELEIGAPSGRGPPPPPPGAARAERLENLERGRALPSAPEDAPVPVTLPVRSRSTGAKARSRSRAASRAKSEGPKLTPPIEIVVAPKTGEPDRVAPKRGRSGPSPAPTVAPTIAYNDRSKSAASSVRTTIAAAAPSKKTRISSESLSLTRGAVANLVGDKARASSAQSNTQGRSRSQGKAAAAPAARKLPPPRPKRAASRPTARA